jgi:hypothetical protein
MLNRRSPLAFMTLLAALAFSPVVLGQTVVGDFECQPTGQSFAFGTTGMGDCEGWTDESLLIVGFNAVADATTPCPGMPSAGNQYGQIFNFPAFTGPSVPFYPLGNTAPIWPFTTGNISIISKTVVAPSDNLSVDWKLLKASISADYFAQILVVDPQTNQVIAPLLVTDTSLETLTAGQGCAPVAGSSIPLDGTAVQTATALLPSTSVGQPIKIVALMGATGVASLPGGGQFLDSGLFVDNFRFAPAPVTATEIVFAPNGTFNATNPQGPGPVSISATVSAFRDANGVLITDPLVDPIVGATCTLTANLLGSGLDLNGAIFSVANVDLTVAPGADELSILAQFNYDPAGDEFGLGGAQGVIPTVTRALDSAFVATATRTGSGSSVLDNLQTELTTLGSDLALVFEIFPGQLPRLDRLVLDFAPHPKPPVFNFDTNGTGDIVLGVAGTNPIDELFNVFVANPTVTQGTGPFFGLEFTPLVADILALPLGAVPFHVSPDADGAFFWGLPPGSLPAGLVLDAAAGTLNPTTGSPTWVSSVVRRTF